MSLQIPWWALFKKKKKERNEKRVKNDTQTQSLIQRRKGTVLEPTSEGVLTAAKQHRLGNRSIAHR